MNVKYLKEVKKEVLKHPRQVNMDWWFLGKDSTGKPAGGCGTAACIGGWLIYVHYKKKKRVRTLKKAAEKVGILFEAEKAAKILGIDDEQQTRLFDAPSWPTHFLDELRNATTAKQYAVAVAKRIDHFIETNGAE